jgi:hypothetical protein
MAVSHSALMCKSCIQYCLTHGVSVKEAQLKRTQETGDRSDKREQKHQLNILVTETWGNFNGL